MTPAKREAAGLIRRTLWRDGCPPSPDRYQWSMARELHAWQRLVDLGTDPGDLNAALRVLRTVYPRARRVTCLLHTPGLLADCLQAVRASEAGRRVAGGDPTRLQLPLAFGTRGMPRAYSAYCGPAVVASVLGITRREAARRLAAIENPTPSGGTSFVALSKVLDSRAWTWPATRPVTLRDYVQRTTREAVVVARVRDPHALHVVPGRVLEANGIVPWRGLVLWYIPIRRKRGAR